MPHFRIRKIKTILSCCVTLSFFWPGGSLVCASARGAADTPHSPIRPTAAERRPAARQTFDLSRYGKRLALSSGGSQVTILYLRGTPYQMGFAQGKLCASEVRYMTSFVAPLMMAGMGVTPEKVDKTWALYARHLRPEYLEELRGLADGAGVSLQGLERGQSIPDMSEWHCTFFAGHGKATRDGQMLQIRALDYATMAGIQRYPALVVYQPQKGIPFVNVGWLGLCGMVTGMNRDGIAMSEIGDNWDKETDSFDGRPLTYVMRDSIQFGGNIAQAVNLVKNGPRTTSLLYCLSSAREGQERMLETSHTQCKVFTSETLPFARMPGLVYASMSMDSRWNKKVGSALQGLYGRLDVEIAEKEIMAHLGTGSLHAVVFKPGTGDLWVANASSSQKAYTQPYLHFNLLNALADPFFQ